MARPAAALSDRAESPAPATSAAACLANTAPPARVNSGSSPTARITSRTAAIACNAVKPRKVAQILHPAHLVVEQRRMRHVTNLAAGVLRSLAENRNLAARRLRQPSQRPQQRGLPRPVVAENRVKSSRIKFRVHAAQRGKASELLDDVPAMTMRGLPAARWWDRSRGVTDCYRVCRSRHQQNLWIFRILCKGLRLSVEPRPRRLSMAAPARPFDASN